MIDFYTTLGQNKKIFLYQEVFHILKVTFEKRRAPLFRPILLVISTRN